MVRTTLIALRRRSSGEYPRGRHPQVETFGIFEETKHLRKSCFRYRPTPTLAALGIQLWRRTTLVNQLFESNNAPGSCDGLNLEVLGLNPTAQSFHVSATRQEKQHRPASTIQQGGDKPESLLEQSWRNEGQQFAFEKSFTCVCRINPSPKAQSKRKSDGEQHHSIFILDIQQCHFLPVLRIRRETRKASFSVICGAKLNHAIQQCNNGRVDKAANPGLCRSAVTENSDEEPGERRRK